VIKNRKIFNHKKNYESLPDNKVICLFERRKNFLTAGIHGVFRGLKNFFNAANRQIAKLDGEL